jgi:hypothetical protein
MSTSGPCLLDIRLRFFVHHRLQTLPCVPLGSDVGCASGKEHRLRVPESLRTLRLLRPRVVVLLAWPQLVLSPGSVACASSAAAAAALWWARGRRRWRAQLLHRQECPGCQPEHFARNAFCVRHLPTVGMVWFNSYTPPHFGRGKRRGRWPPEAEVWYGMVPPSTPPSVCSGH